MTTTRTYTGRTYAATPQEGCPGTGTLNDALPGSRVSMYTDDTERDAHISQALVKCEDGMWGMAVTVDGTEYAPTTYNMDAKQVEWYCFRHQFQPTVDGGYGIGYRFTGMVRESVTPDNFCRRCGGTGFTVFTHIDGGLCFDCRGSGVRR